MPGTFTFSYLNPADRQADPTARPCWSCSTAATWPPRSRRRWRTPAPGYRVRDLWTGEETETTGALGATVGRHAATVLRGWPASVTAAPRTSLTVELPDPVPPSRPLTATVRFTNAGSTPITGAHLQLTAPPEWQFDSATEASAPTVNPGTTGETAVTLHPISTATQPFEMPATVTYTTNAGARTLAVSAESPLLPAPNPPYSNGLLAVDDASDGSAGDRGDWLSPYLSC
ncbi:NEW3 domain-containing protein [Amycolatopsis sp. CA-128772]|uniref:NEW3 domain-containing protein n=1 Tax=Amycolatopsis sp. CA-128772 TaxID=2073159 RepID=UPI001E4749FF|nr:NEW3 domain-containing protein [Amycolatopsis sp. CA-128772]